MSFLPADYKEPSSNGNYFKIQKDIENRIRILSKPVMGWEDWNELNKPVRFAYESKPLAPIMPDKKIKLFWAFVIWNYNEKQIQIMHITQSTIRKAIQDLVRDSDWGDPYSYDIKITRRGDGMDTEYVINPVPHKALESDIAVAFKDKPCCLNALFTGADPWAPGQEPTPMEGVKPSAPKSAPGEFVSDHQIHTLVRLFNQNDEVRLQVMARLKEKDIQQLLQVPSAMYEQLYKFAFSLAERLEEQKAKELDLPF